MAIFCSCIISRASPIPTPEFARVSGANETLCWFLCTILHCTFAYALPSIWWSCSSSPPVSQNLIHFSRLSLNAMLVMETFWSTSPIPSANQKTSLSSIYLSIYPSIHLSLKYLLFLLKNRNHSLLFNNHLWMCQSSLSRIYALQGQRSNMIDLCVQLAFRTDSVLWKYS